MLKERIITAIIMVALLLLALFTLSSQAFVYVLLAILFLSAWEWADLASLSQPLVRIIYATAVTACAYFVGDWAGVIETGFSSRWAQSLTQSTSLRDVLGVGVLWWAFALLWVLSYPGSAQIWKHPAVRGVMGFLVLVPSLVGLFYLNQQSGGQWYFLYVIGIVSSADIGAYFVGKRFGSRKLAPAVSPGKSWEGFFGGMVAAGIFAALIGGFYDVLRLSYIELIVVTMLASLASVLGDLLESMVKRERGIKDSSQLLPGHGGFMDRIDSLSAATPVFVLLTLLLTQKF